MGCERVRNCDDGHPPPTLCGACSDDQRAERVGQACAQPGWSSPSLAIFSCQTSGASFVGSTATSTSHRVHAANVKFGSRGSPDEELATATGVATKVAKHMTTVFCDIIMKEVKKNGSSIVPGIGKLVRVERKARMGRNPATGETIKIAAKKVVKFRVAKAVKDSIVPAKKK